MEIFPHLLALQFLIKNGIKFNQVYNDKGGIKRNQLTALALLPKFSQSVRQNSYLTINRLELSKNKKQVDFTANIKNTMVGTVSGAICDDIYSLPDDTLIKWLPSSAHEHDPEHALHYGQVMTLKKAKKLGLGVRYGCQCGMRILDKKVAEKARNITRKL